MPWPIRNEPRYREIIVSRREGLTLEDVGKKLGASRERIRQMEALAVVKMGRGHGLLDLLPLTEHERQIWRRRYPKDEPASGEVRPIQSTDWIDRLSINTRIHNALCQEGIKTVGQVVKFTGPELLRLPNLSLGSLAVLKAALAEHGIHLAGEQARPGFTFRLTFYLDAVVTDDALSEAEAKQWVIDAARRAKVLISGKHAKPGKVELDGEPLPPM